MADDTFHWLDVEFIGELLAEHYPDRDPMRIGFVDLKKLVMALPGFQEKPGLVVNEKILEHVQAAWIEERGGGGASPEED
jgi:FeS assembly protein IscX